MERVSLTDKVLVRRADLPGLLQERKLDVVLSLGAGDIDRLVPGIQRLLNGSRHP